jgi:hypothetical protein
MTMNVLVFACLLLFTALVRGKIIFQLQMNLSFNCSLLLLVIVIIMLHNHSLMATQHFAIKRKH